MLQFGRVQLGALASPIVRGAVRHVLLDELQEVLVERLEYGFPEQLGLRPEVAEQLRLGDIGLARHGRRGGPGITQAFEFMCSRTTDEPAQILRAAASAPAGGARALGARLPR